MILIEDLYKSFESWGGIRKPIIRALNLELAGGFLYHIVGPNGCGKSTLLNLICGRLFPDNGKILINGKDSADIHWRDRPRITGVVTQDPLELLFPDLTLAENLALALPGIQKGDLFGRATKRGNLAWLEKQFVQLRSFYDRPMELMSGGELQLSALAIALLGQPKILLLDEFISALSTDNKTVAMSKVAEFLVPERLALATYHGTIDLPSNSVRIITMPGDGSATLTR